MLTGQLGWNPFSAVTDAIASGAGFLIDKVGWSIRGSCSVTNNNAVQTAAAVARKVPNPYTQVYGTAVQVAGALCAWAFGGGTEPPPQFPLGTIYTIDPATGLYHIAIPTGSTLTKGFAGLGDTFTPGSMGILQLVTADIYNAAAIPDYTNRVRKDSPYLAVESEGHLGYVGELGSAYVEVGIVPKIPGTMGNFKLVDLDTYNDLTGKSEWWNHWYVLAAGGLVAIGIIWAVS